MDNYKKNNKHDKIAKYTVQLYVLYMINMVINKKVNSLRCPAGQNYYPNI